MKAVARKTVIVGRQRGAEAPRLAQTTTHQHYFFFCFFSLSSLIAPGLADLPSGSPDPSALPGFCLPVFFCVMPPV